MCCGFPKMLWGKVSVIWKSKCINIVKWKCIFHIIVFVRWGKYTICIMHPKVNGICWAYTMTASSPIRFTQYDYIVRFLKMSLQEFLCFKY